MNNLLEIILEQRKERDARHSTILSKRHHIRKAIVSAALLIVFVFSSFCARYAIAATSEVKAQPSPNPTVLFEKGLLTVQAKGVTLQALMEEVSQKAGIGGSVREGSQKKERSHEE